MSNPNLLPNWYYKEPINQRGGKEYTGPGSTIDTVICTAGWGTKFTVTENGLKIDGAESGYFHHYVEFNAKQHVGKLITFSVLDANNNLYSGTGIIPSTFPNWRVFGLITECGVMIDLVVHENLIGYQAHAPKNTTVTIQAVKPELNPFQTLAHKEGDTWVLNDPPPDPVLELLKCQRYQVFGPMESVNITNNGQTSVAFLPLAVPLRDTPTIVGNPTVWAVDGNAEIKNVTITAERVLNNGVLLYVYGSDTPCYVSFKSGDGLDASL